MSQNDFFALLSRGAILSKRESGSQKRAVHEQEQQQQQQEEDDEVHHQRRKFEQHDALTTEGDAVGWRDIHGVKVEGEDLPLPITSFSELRARFEVRKYVTRNLLGLEYVVPTLVQSECIPILLSQRDLIACAPTGSGKTVAFVVPMLARLGSKHVEGGPRALIVTPTHELAAQIARVVEVLSAGKSLSVCLLTSTRAAKPAKWANNGTWDVVVATPMRLLKLLQRENSPLHLDTVEYLVLDEADRLFEADFVEQADEIFAACTNPSLQRALFSATIGERPERLARAIMFSPIRVIVGARIATLPHEVLHQELVYVGTEQGKMIHFRSLLTKGLEPPILIFMQNRQRAMELFRLLINDRVNVDILSQDRTEAQRAAAVDGFRAGTVWILIATDVLGRGIDFKGVNWVINWDMPKSVPDYIHRVGRTGRAGRQGRAVTYFEDVDLHMAKAVAQIIKRAGGDPPHYLLQPSKAKKKFKGATLVVERQSVKDGATKPPPSKKKKIKNNNSNNQQHSSSGEEKK